jgi:hypothetical protein
MSARRLSVPMIVWSLMALFTALVLGAEPQPDTPDSSAASAIEQALIEHACRATRPSASFEHNEYDECLSAQLLSMRADLGRDLGGLSTPERKTLDSVCGDIRAAGGRQAYLECLSARLLTIRNRRRSEKPPPSDQTALAPPVASAPPASAAPAARRASSWSFGLWIGAGLLASIVAVGGVLLALKARRPPRKCRGCGADLSESGDLCHTCRREAADAVRSAAAERDRQQRAQRAEAEEQRRQSEHVEELRLQSALQEEADASLRQQDGVRQQEQDAREREADAQQRQAEEARQRSQHDVVSQDEFDPYTVLGVPRGASIEDIGVAYQAAKLKYDPDHVTHLSVDVQDHYKAKALAVERAYQNLSESP